MQSKSVTVGHASQAYDSRPWLQHYPPDVPPTLDLPRDTIWDVLEDVAARHRDHPAFVFQHYPMTYGDTLRHSNEMAAGLVASGVAKGDVVFALLPNVPHFPITYYGTVKLGAALSSISPLSTEREIENVLRDTGARIIVTLDLHYEKVANVWERAGVETVIVGTVTDFMPPWIRLAGRFSSRVPKPRIPVPYGPRVRRMRRFLRDAGATDVPQQATADDVALLQYTGGTTGVPKAAMLTHYSLLSNARQMVSWFPSLRSGEVTILSIMPFFHVYGVTLALNAGMFLAARNILIAGGWVPSEVFEAIQRYRPTVLPGIPTLFVAITNDKRSREVDLSSIDISVSGAAPLPEQVKREFESITGGHLYEAYGLSEASPATHAQPYNQKVKRGIGIPLPNTEARIVNAETDQPVPVGEVGELVIRGPQVMKGYWRRPADTEAVLRNGWLHTGDIARMDESGNFFIVDRIKDLIITGGENIYPAEVEEVLYQHPKVKEVAVVGVPHSFGGEVAKAFIVLKPDENATKKDITQFAAERLAKHKVPRAVEFREELPKSPAGKVLRRILAEEEKSRQVERKKG